MTDVHVNRSIKALRETLCIAQSAIGERQYDVFRKKHDIGTIQELIADCDRQRPLAANGKHGNMHTPTCGCEDKGLSVMWDPLPSEKILHGVLNRGEMKVTWCGEDARLSEITKEFGSITCDNCLAQIMQNV